MINLNTNIAKRRYWLEYNRGLINFEKNMYSRLHSALKRQYLKTAESITQNQITGINRSIIKYGGQIYKILIQEYQRIGSIYNQDVTRRLKKKAVDTVFWGFFLHWLKYYAAEKVVAINETTKNILKKIIEVKKAAGFSYLKIAEYIKENIDNLTIYRALKIARTEVHTGINTAIHESVAITERMEEHEWLAAMDGRTRDEHMQADGERVPIDQPFTETGEPLMYPGDPSGSAWNIINCRCVELFHTREVA